MKSYDYAHRQGINEISWQRFDALSNALVESLSPHAPQMVLGIARAGLFPATAVACKLRIDLSPVRVTRREADRVVREQPIWKVGVPDDVTGKTVAVVDEIADSGETLRMVGEQARVQGAARVVTAALVAHSWARPFPDAVALTSDALVIFPWDKMVYMLGEWRLHPELADALALQTPSHASRAGEK